MDRECLDFHAKNVSKQSSKELHIYALKYFMNLGEIRVFILTNFAALREKLVQLWK